MMSDLLRKACGRAGAVPRRAARPRLAWLAIVLVAAWLVAACTDGGNETTQTGSAAGETGDDLTSDSGGGGQTPTLSRSR